MCRSINILYISDSSKTQLPSGQTNITQNMNQIRQSTPDPPDFSIDFEVYLPYFQAKN